MHPFVLLVGSLPVLVVGVLIPLLVLNQGLLTVNPIFLAALIAIVAVVLAQTSLWAYREAFPVLKSRKRLV